MKGRAHLLWLIISVIFIYIASGERKCGRASGDTLAATPVVKRILGGHVSSPDQWPWVVSVRVYQRRGHMTCGGGIISKDWVITAAHCLEQENVAHGVKPLQVEVIMGKKTVLAELRDGERIPVDKVFFHPQRQHGQHGKIGRHDIALLHLLRPITEDEGVIPLCLPPADPIQDGYPCSIAGWGRQQVYSGGSPFLRHVLLTVISNRQCSDILNMEVYPDQMCAMADAHHSTCKGDSGTPLACYYMGRYHLTGIVSFGTPCGIYSEPTPTVLSRVSSYTRWMLNVITEYEHQRKS